MNGSPGRQFYLIGSIWNRPIGRRCLQVISSGTFFPAIVTLYEFAFDMESDVYFEFLY